MLWEVFNKVIWKDLISFGLCVYEGCDGILYEKDISDAKTYKCLKIFNIFNNWCWWNLKKLLFYWIWIIIECLLSFLCGSHNVSNFVPLVQTI